MNKLKKYAGLLNEEAPENHFLAYITPSERDMLVDAGGKETSTASGIFAYPPPGEVGGAGYVGGGSSNKSYNPGAGGVVQHSPTKSKTTSNIGGTNDNKPDKIQRIASGIEPGYRPQDAQPYGLSKEEAYRQGKITKDQYESTDVSIDRSTQESPPWFDNIKNYILSGGIIGQTIELTGEVLSKLGEHSSELQKKAMTMSLNSKVKRKMKDLDLNNPNSMNNPVIADLHKDLAGIEAGTFTQKDFTEKYGSGDLGGEGEGGNIELMNTFVPYAAHAVGGTEQQPSMVDQYFSSLGNNNLGISSNYTNTYNTAKANIANTLNMTPNTQQYGYTANPYSQYPSTMTSANPFFDELTEQGLI
jgi:hypothetical protein